MDGVVLADLAVESDMEATRALTSLRVTEQKATEGRL
jgi:hypothetical protein